MKKIIHCLAAFGIISAILLYFLSLTPLMADNFVFSRAITPGFDKFYSGSPIITEPLTLQNAFSQARDMYLNWCGRFFGNLAVYILFMLPRWFYCILAACCFSFYILLLAICVFGAEWRQRLSAGWIFGIAALVWVSSPSFGETFLWLSVGGQIALLGQALVFLPFRFALDRRRPPKTRLTVKSFTWFALLFILGAVAASLDYPTSAALPPTGIACAAWVYFRQKKPLRRIPWPLVFLCAGLLSGAIFTLGAPGNAMRLILTRDPEVHAWLAASWGERLGNWLLHLPGAIFMQAVPLIWILWSISALRRHYGKSWFRHVPEAVYLFMLPAMLTTGSYLMTSWPPARAFATVNVQLVLAAAILFTASEQFANRILWRRYAILRAMLILYCLVSLPLEGARFFSFAETTAQREKLLFEAKGNTVELPAYPPWSDNRYWVLGGNLADISEEKDFWVNRGMAAHYGLGSVVLAPQQAHEFVGAPTLPERVNLKVDKARIWATISGYKEEPETDIHIYYYGKPALLDYFPSFAARPIFNWLSRGQQGDYRNLLVPLLLARADVRVAPDETGIMRGRSDPIKIRDDAALWLVRPGGDKLSLDVEPFARVNSCGI